MRLGPTLLNTTAFSLALVLSALIAGGGSTVIEMRTSSLVRVTLEAAGHSWAGVSADGLQVTLTGTAPSEAERFRTMALVGTVIDASRIVDLTEVAVKETAPPPAFSMEILRNDDGISLIGLVPTGVDREKLVADLKGVAANGNITDLLEAANYPVPDGWQAAMNFGISTLKTLPRSKISVAADKVAVTALTDSTSEKSRVETALNRSAPKGLRLALDISAPHPVITPFTLRFLIDDEGARFDACSADTERASSRILQAARAAGATGALGCTVGMGVPTPAWADAVTMGLAAMKELGAGSITFSDADISLIAADSVSQAAYDKVVGELESNLPEVFSLTSVLTEKPKADVAGPPEFTATRGEDGKVQLRGRLSDEALRTAVENLAKARFGNAAVYGATRTDNTLPGGWPVRVLAAVDVLAALENGSVTVTPDMVRVNGVTGDTQTSDKVARVLSDRLGDGAQFDLSIRYDKRLDPVLGLPTGAECVQMLNDALAANKISFEPGSSVIVTGSSGILDTLAKIMGKCQEFKMEISGYTDSQGSEGFNQQLSQDRAASVVQALMERRVLTGNLTARGYGEANPVADNGTETGREANRRIEFVLLDATPDETMAANAGAETEGAGTESTEAEITGAESTGADAATEAETEPEASDTPDMSGDIVFDEDPNAAPMEDGGEGFVGEETNGLNAAEGAATEDAANTDDAGATAAQDTSEAATAETAAEDESGENASDETTEAAPETGSAEADAVTADTDGGISAAPDGSITIDSAIEVQTPDADTPRPAPRPDQGGN